MAAKALVTSVEPRRPSVARVVERTGSAIALAHVDEGLVAYVADEEDRRVLVVDVAAMRVVGEHDLDGMPGQLVTLPGARVAIALRDRAEVVVLEGAGVPAWPFRVGARFDVPSEPIGLAVTPDDASVVVASGWGHAISVVSLAHGAQLTKELGREPRAVAVARDGRHAFVAHAVGGGLSVVDLVNVEAKAKVWLLESESWVPGFRDLLAGPFKRMATQGYAVAIAEEPSGRVFLPHVAAHTAFGSEPAALGLVAPPAITGYGSADAGPAEVFDVAVIDEASGTPLDFERRPDGDGDARARLATEDTSCLLPRGAVASGMNVYVACLDSDRVLELDAASLRPQRLPLRSWQVPRGPTALAVDRGGKRLFVWSTFARSLSALAIADGAGALPLASLKVVARAPLAPELARGRDLFHSGETRISGDHRACASCHPDGRDDGFVWATPDGPRQTPMLAGRLEGTAPYGWTGAAHDVASHVPKTFARLGGKGVAGADKDALLAYVRALPAPPAPRIAGDPRIELGRAVFHSLSAGCATCHGVRGESPDGERHNVKSWANGDTRGAFDTPSLRFVGGTGPWFHDGRYRTLRDLLVRSDGSMGKTKHLAPGELDALEAYLQSL